MKTSCKASWQWSRKARFMVFRALVTAEAVGGELLTLSGVIADMTGWRHKWLLSNLRGKGRSMFVSSETWHVTNKDSPTGREEEGGVHWRAWMIESMGIVNKDSLAGGVEEGGVHWWAWKCSTLQTRTHLLEGRKRKEPVGKFGNIAHHKWGLTDWRGGLELSLKWRILPGRA